MRKTDFYNDFPGSLSHAQILGRGVIDFVFVIEGDEESLSSMFFNDIEQEDQLKKKAGS